MAGRKSLPDLMGEALGRVPLRAPRQVLNLPVGMSMDREDLTRRLTSLGLGGMAQCLRQDQDDELASRPASVILERLIAAEENRRREQKQSYRLRRAALPQMARLEDLDYELARGLPRGQVHTLAQGEWLRNREDLIVTGPVGVGKTFLACALARQACLEGLSVLYQRLNQLLRGLGGGRRSGPSRVLRQLERLDLLVLDDWGARQLQRWLAEDLLEILDLRHGRASTMVISCLEPTQWREPLGGGDSAEAIMDRLCSRSHWVRMQGGSVRRRCQPAEARAAV